MSLAAVPIIGLIAVMFVGRAAENRQTAAELIYEQQRAAVDTIVRLSGHVGEMRIAGDAFRRTLDQAQAEAFIKSGDDAAQLLNELLQREKSDATMALERAMGSYVETFGRVRELTARIGKDNSEGLQGALAFSALKLKGEFVNLEAMLGSWTPVLRDTMFELFMTERDFRYYQSNAYVNQFERQHTSLGQIAVLTKLDPQLRDVLDKSIKDYGLKFGEWVDGVQYSQNLYNHLAVHYLTIGQRVGDLQASAIERMTASRRAAAEIADSMQTWTLILFGLVIAMSVLIAGTIGIQVARELGGLSSAMRQLATGDASVSIPAIRRQDEVGEMATALTALRDGVRERLVLVAENEASAEAQLKRARTVEDAVVGFETSVREALSGLHDASEAMRQVSRELDEVAVEAEAQAISAAGDTSRAATEIEAAAVAAQQLSGSVDEVATQAMRSDQAAADALREVQHVSGAMSELMRQAERIGEIVGLISGIAGQTNLLALNATIEAARAGEAGRGFAVVASEVKILASQTGVATNDIASQIDGIRAASRDVITVVAKMNGTIAEVSRIAASVAAAVEEQSASLAGISGNIVAASEGASRGANGIRTVESAVADTTRNASRVRDMSEKLSGDASRLNDQVAWFLNTVRAA